MKASRVVRALYGRNGLFKARLTALRPAGAGIPSASPRRAAFSSEAYAGRITNVMGRIATLQDVLDEKSPTWRELVRRTSQSVADAPLKLLVVGEDYSGKSFVIRALLDDDTVDANTSSFLAKSLGDLAAPTRVVFGDKPSLEPAAASSPFALMNVPTQWLKYCNVEIIYLPGLYSFDFGGNKQILDLSLLEADAALLVTDVSRQLMGSREIAIMQRLQKMGKGDRIVAVVNQTDRLDNEAVQVTRLSKEIPQRARTYAPSFSSPVFFTAAKRALVGDIHGAPIDPTCYQRRMAAAGIDSLREHLLGNVLKPANHVAAKYITNLAVGELALDRLEREVEVVTKTVANYHHEVNFLIEAIQREQKRIVEDVTKRVETEIARVLNESEIAATDYVEKRSLWRFLLRMEPISLEATRRLMGGNLVPVANAPGAESGSTIWDGIRSLREVEVLFGHAVGRADGIMSTLASNLRNMLARIAQSKALNRHTLAKELELEMAKVMDLIDNELEGSRGMNPVRTVAQPLAAYEAKVRKEGDHVQATGDKTALATLGFEVGVVGSALLATHLGVPGILTAAIGGVLAISGLLLMKGRWRSLKYYYGQNVAEHGLKLRRDLNASLQRELERTYGKRLESIIDMYQRAHGHHLNLVDDKGYQVKEELRVVRNISTELRRLL